MIVTGRDRKVLAHLVLIFGLFLTLAGLFGVWLQGRFYERGFPTAATFGEVRLAFTGPTTFAMLGSLLVSWALLSSPVTAAWSARRRFMAFCCFGVFVLLVAAICGHMATSKVAGILN